MGIHVCTNPIKSFLKKVAHPCPLLWNILFTKKQLTVECRHSKCELISTVLYSFSDINCVLYADPNLLCTVPVLFIYICLSGVHCVPVLFIYICLSGVLCVLYCSYIFVYLVYFVYCADHTFVYLV